MVKAASVLICKKMSSSRLGVVVLATGLLLLVFTPNLVDCISLEIKDNQNKFTFQAGMTSNIEFNIVNGTCTCEITLYLYKKTVSGESNHKCKLVLTQNCKKYSGDCSCAAAIVNTRHGYKMWRTFHVQDTGDWIFEVWDTDVRKTITIRVEGNGTSEDSLFSAESFDSFSVLRSNEFILFSLCFNVVCTIAITAVVVTLIVRRQRKFSSLRQNYDAGDDHLYANDITVNAVSHCHTVGGQTVGDYLAPVSRSNVYVTSYGKETALDASETFQLEVTGRRQSSASEEQCEHISRVQDLTPPPSPPLPPAPPPPPTAREDHQLTALQREALLPPPPPLPLLPNHPHPRLGKNTFAVQIN